MGPEDQHEQPAEKDGYEKWLDEMEAKKFAKLIAEFPPKYSQASELDADEFDSEFGKGKNRE